VKIFRHPVNGGFLIPALLVFFFTALPAYPLEPLSKSPGFILSYPENSWRDRRFEVFSWDAFPEILIFDTASYAVQDRLFKRLAFFVPDDEKLRWQSVNKI